jgi:signal transduction histidine kinase
MQIMENRNLIRWLVSLAALCVVTVILWNTYVFFERLKDVERKKMEQIAYVGELYANSTAENEELNNIFLYMQATNTTTPVIQENIKGQLSGKNLPDEVMKDTAAMRRLQIIYASENEPVVLFDENNDPFVWLYYGNSDTINKLKFFPLALLLVVVLFGTVIYFFFKSIRVSEQNRLWAGIAKESAHQIGTPLSSLIGWLTLLRESEVDQSYVDEMSKDITRLETITTRFSKIGSQPTLSKTDLVSQTQKSMEYISSRSSNLIEFETHLPDTPIYTHLNADLYSWTIENLIKNGIDAMKGKGRIEVTMEADKKWAYVRISDDGSGIPKGKWKKIFEPGYTTKKRGWGLGLSLVKRIIQEYHQGRIRVLTSQPDEGTTFEIKLKIVE